MPLEECSTARNMAHTKTLVCSIGYNKLSRWITRVRGTCEPGLLTIELADQFQTFWLMITLGCTAQCIADYKHSLLESSLYNLFASPGFWHCSLKEMLTGIPKFGYGHGLLTQPSLSVRGKPDRTPFRMPLFPRLDVT